MNHLSKKASHKMAHNMRFLVFACSAIACSGANADFSDLFGRFSTELEEESATAALQTYTRLIEEEGCTDQSRGFDQDGSSCVGRIYRIFNNVREIVHTGNDITGSGPIEFSLGSDLEGLGFALRWLAAEEYAAQGDMSSDFVSGQISGLGSRLSALRFGARGFQFVQNGVWNPSGEYAYLDGATGGAAGTGANYSRLGGFLNVQTSFGSREATGLEDAFDNEGYVVTGGLDFRVNDEWIVGGMLGYSDQTIDFDSSQSIVEGEIVSSGFNIMPFFMYQPGYFYISGSLGYQQLSFDSLRAIRYPSFNPSTESTNTETISETDASIISGFAEAGYSFIWKKMTFEPYLGLSTSSVSIDEFIEDDVNDDAFDLVVKAQDFSTLDLTLGIKTQYTFTPRAGVFIPYFTVEYVGQTDTASRDIEAYYAGLSSTDSAFVIPTEELDSDYQTVSLGMSAVLRGGRELTPGGGVGGDIQGFINIKQITGLDGYELTFFSFGARYAF